ncbi:CPBP family intramembrane glutamic endopeptidase [Thalassorhabdus alkalitolerans]|uniref:CPBP family intramembrane glutamic endopeptidase n=1 Tax=Thalassorhabdus alkalitolerans TaxID=2282697 RepID=A0ABW0YJM1_9BACI|nr:CPBP family intramembrane glutamic endopeptidase [Thalassobacillus sp. C254]
MERDITFKAVWAGFFIFIFIGFMILIFGMGDERWFYLLSLFGVENIFFELIAGIAGGGIFAGLTWLVYKFSRASFPKNEQTTLILQLMNKRFGIATIAWGAGVSEEFLFRGVLLGLLWIHFNEIWALLISSLVFMALHIPQYKGSLVMHTIVLMMGLFLGWLFIQTGTLWAPIMAHAVYNGVISYAIKYRILPIESER